MKNSDPLSLLRYNPNRILGVCATIIVILLILALSLSSMWPLTVAAVPLAIGSLTYIANSGEGSD